jgi:hypothetical protein
MFQYLDEMIGISAMVKNLLSCGRLQVEDSAAGLAGGKEDASHERGDGASGSRVVHGRTEYIAVRVSRNVEKLIDPVGDLTASGFPAASAGSAPG